MFVAVLLAVPLAAAADPAAPVQYARPNLLVEPAAVTTPAARNTVRVLDLRGDAKYAAGHVPGAVAAPFERWGKAVKANTADARFWRKELAAVGVRPDLTVAVYSDDVREAARGWWMLKLAGVPDVRLMNGGWDAYKLSDGKIATDATLAAAEPVEWVLAADRLATKDDVVALAKRKPEGVQIVDARTPEEYRGERKLSKQGGHVPGAVSAEWTTFVDVPTQRFKSPAELAEALKARGIDLGKPAVTYCQAGGRSSVVAFTLELMGANGVRNYDCSWSEYGNDPDAPVAAQ